MTSSHVPELLRNSTNTFKRKRVGGQKTSWYYYENNVNFVDKRSGNSQVSWTKLWGLFTKAFINLGLLIYAKWTSVYRTIQPQMSQVPLWMDCYPFHPVICELAGGLLHINSVGGVFIHCSLRYRLDLLHFSQVPDQMFLLRAAP